MTPTLMACLNGEAPDVLGERTQRSRPLGASRAAAVTATARCGLSNAALRGSGMSRSAIYGVATGHQRCGEIVGGGARSQRLRAAPRAEPALDASGGARAAIACPAGVRRLLVVVPLRAVGCRCIGLPQER